DAKLRVQMRAEVLRVQQRLGTTTPYVTHDQTEAMNTGDRGAGLAARAVGAVRCAAGALRPAREFVRGFVHRVAEHEPVRGGAGERRGSGGVAADRVASCRRPGRARWARGLPGAQGR